MKRYFITILLLMAAPWLRAQTNPTPAGPALITSRTGDFDMNTRTATYLGDVHVVDPEMKLRCEWLSATLPTSGGHIDHIVCETNVVIDYSDEKSQTNHITSDRAVYDYNVQGVVTNETITFTGSPRIENAQAIITGEPIIWHRDSGKFEVTNEKMIFKQGIGGLATQTNTPAKPE
jgi:lipopolysaccharide transport protein LptA